MPNDTTPTTVETLESDGNIWRGPPLSPVQLSAFILFSVGSIAQSWPSLMPFVKAESFASWLCCKNVVLHSDVGIDFNCAFWSCVGLSIPAWNWKWFWIIFHSLKNRLRWRLDLRPAVTVPHPVTTRSTFGLISLTSVCRQAGKMLSLNQIRFANRINAMSLAFLVTEYSGWRMTSYWVFNKFKWNHSSFFFSKADLWSLVLLLLLLLFGDWLESSRVHLLRISVNKRQML